MGSSGKLINSAAIIDGSIMSADINAAAGILGSQLGGGVGRAVTRTVAASNASPLIKAMADYVCDGVNDETEINAALASLPVGVGGTVQMSEGQFNINGQINYQKPYSTLRGMGSQATILRVINSSTGCNGVVISHNQGNSSLEDFKFDGNRTNNGGATAMTLLYMAQAYGRIRNLWVTSSQGQNIVFDASAFRHRITDSIFQDCEGSGMVVGGAANSQHQIYNNHFRDNREHGIVVQTGAGHQILNNIIINNSQKSGSTYQNIFVQVPCSIHGNFIRGSTDGSNHPAYGIYISGAVDAYLGNNDIGPHNSGPIYDASLSTRRPVRLQLDYNPTADIVSGAYTGGNWVSIHTGQNFSVSSPSSIMEFTVICSMTMNCPTQNVRMSTRLLINGGTNGIYYLAGGQTTAANGGLNPLQGLSPLKVRGSAMGSVHPATYQAQVQVWMGASGTIQLQPSSQNQLEHFRLQITEYLQ